MRVSIVTFGDLGEVKNLKTADILPVIDKFAQEGCLDQVLCRRERNFYFKNTQGAFSTLGFFGLKALGSVLRPVISMRALEWKALDRWVSKRLKGEDVVIFHPAVFPKALEACRRSGAIGIGLATIAHPSYLAELKKEEYGMLDIPVDGNKVPARESSVDKFDYVIAFSDFVKQTYVKSGFPEEKIFVANSDIDSTKFIPPKGNTKDPKFRVLYAASTTPLKGLQYLLEAWNFLEIDDAMLTLVGGYKKIPLELKKKFEDVIKNDPTIEDVGHTNNIIEYYQRSSVFVLPSLTEGNPRVVMEAMACGLPVITTDHARSIVEDGKTGFVVPIRDLQAIREKIRFLYDNPDITEEMGREARRAVESKKDFGEAVFEIYNEILRREGKK